MAACKLQYYIIYYIYNLYMSIAHNTWRHANLVQVYINETLGDEVWVNNWKLMENMDRPINYNEIQ